MKRIFMAATTASAIALSACSGGGGGGGINTTPPPTGSTPTPTPAPTPGSTPAPTPTPTPEPTPSPTPTPAPGGNTSLLDLRVGESFANDGAGGSATFPKSGAMPTMVAGNRSMTIAFDPGNSSYTITAPGRSQTFRASDIDAALSTPQVTVYVRTVGATQESLTITKPGTSGRFTYQYVAGGYWERIVEGSSAFDGTLDAIAYGIATPAAAVPRTGTARYTVDLLGAELEGQDLVGIAGSGILDADFGRGALVVHGELNAARTPNAAFSGEARIASGGNSFSGVVRFEDYGVFSGGMSGRFYGPNGEEVGASWYATSTVVGNKVAAGTIIGRKDNAPVTPATSFTGLTSSQFFAGDVGTSSGNFSGNAVAGQASERGTVIVHYDADRRTYTVMGADRSQYYGPWTIDDYIYDDFIAFAPGTLKYVRAGEARRRKMVTGAPYEYRFDDIVYGFSTPDTALPRTGNAAYDLRLNGTLFRPGDTGPLEMDGDGTLSVNFASGAIDLSGGARAGSFLPNNVAGSGSFSGTARLASTANRFAGTFQLNLFGQRDGTVDGRFYGPQAEEVGASFAVRDAAGNVASGTLVGASNPAILLSRIGLAELTAPTDFLGYSLGLHWQYPMNNRGMVYSNWGLISANQLTPRLRWDPATSTYTVSKPLGGPIDGEAFTTSFGPAEKVAAESNGTFSVYRGSTGNLGWTARVYNVGSGNGELALTYTSFADFSQVRSFPPGVSTENHHYFLPFGNQTLASQMPRAGTASYSGILYGRGGYTPGGSEVTDFYALSGTSGIDANFASGTMTGWLQILGARDGASGRDFGRFDFSGQVGTTFNMSQSGSATTGSWVGQFNGPNAAEYGGIFSITQQPGTNQSTGELVTLTGVAVGKKRP